MGVAHQGDAVPRAPVGQAAVVDLALHLQDHPVVQAGGGVFLPAEEGGKVGEDAAGGGEGVLKALGPGEGGAGVAPHDAGLVGEEGDDGGAEPLLQPLVVGVVGQADEQLDRVGVQKVGAGRGVGLAVVLAEVDAPDGPAGKAGHQQPAGGAGQELVPLFKGGVRGQQVDAAGGVVGVCRHHLPAGRAGGVHPLVVEDDAHPEALGLPDGRLDGVEKGFGEVGHRPRQADAGVQHHPVHPVGGKVLQLAAQLVRSQLVVQKPEGEGGVFPPRPVEQVDQFHPVLLSDRVKGQAPLLCGKQERLPEWEEENDGVTARGRLTPAGSRGP